MMQNIAGVRYSTSEQHQEASAPRLKVDGSDFDKVYLFLEEREPFRENSPLINIVTGVEAGAHVNCHKSLSIGNCILNNMVGQDIYKHTFKRTLTAKTMNTVSVDDKKGNSFVIDPNLMFQRLLTATIIRRDGIDIADVFRHELSVFPPRLFASDTMMLNSDNKSQLLTTIKAVEDETTTNEENMNYVVDGGMLVQRIPWKVGASFSDIMASYHTFLAKYSSQKTTVVFDGYKNSTKDMVYQKRTRHFNCANIHPVLTSRLTLKKQHFLSNLANKQRLVNLLKAYLERKGYTCLAARDDADVLMCRAAVNLYSHSKNVTLVGDDTDLLVILVSMTSNGMYNKKLFLSTKACTYDIKSVRNQLGPKATSAILLLHSFTGCDTTSRILGIGQDRLLKLVTKIDNQVISTFYAPDSSKDDVKIAGEKLFDLLLNLSANEETLDATRLNIFQSKVIKGSAVIECKSLPPTSAAAEQHSYRVYLQIQTWREIPLDTEQWGWKLHNGKYVPIPTLMPAAPVELMSIMHCNCKSGCKNNQCTCRKNGLDCGPGCNKCEDICENREL